MGNAAHRNRRSVRLPVYDYTWPGAYFVTVVTRNRQSLFGAVQDGQVRLNEYGRIVAEEWFRSAEIGREVHVDTSVVMPNHVHGIVLITGARVGANVLSNVGAHGRAPLQRPPRSLGALIAGFKAASTKRINAVRGTTGVPVWQRNYYEHVVRDEEDLDRIREYILSNPLRWELDEENPTRPISRSATSAFNFVG